MKKDIGLVGAGVVMLATLAWLPDAQAQRSPWWERQKAAQAAQQATAAGASANAGGNAAVAPGAASYPATGQGQAYVNPVRREQVEGPAYTYIEAGAARMQVSAYDIDEHGNGGYARASLALTDNMYLFGGYDRVSRSYGLEDFGSAKIAIEQSQIGLGGSIALTPRVDFIGELSAVRLGASVSTRLDILDGAKVSISDHLSAAKGMLGVRARPLDNLELWAKAGYLRVEDNLVIESSMVGNLGIQYRFTPVWGLVGEAEFYDDVQLYRVGVRASF